MTQLTDFAKSHAKALTAFVVTVAGGAVAQGLVTGQAALWVLLIVGAITGAAVHGVPNKPAGDNGQAVIILLVLIAVGVALLLAGWAPR